MVSQRNTLSVCFEKEHKMTGFLQRFWIKTENASPLVHDAVIKTWLLSGDVRVLCHSAQQQQQQQLHWWRQTAASVSDSSVLSIHAGSLADQWHARWAVKPRLHILALQQAAAGRRPRRRARPIRHHRYAWPVRHGGWPKEARVHHGDVHHLQSLHQGLRLAASWLGWALIWWIIKRSAKGCKWRITCQHFRSAVFQISTIYCKKLCWL